uniref:Uncharacterized protein n=1 Tax=Plectus sambesii TaxID=2011161 RepID=A0A914VGT5_9BILA
MFVFLGIIITLTVGAVALTAEEAGNAIDNINRNASEWLKEENESLKNAAIQNAKEVAHANKVALESLKKAENKTLTAVRTAGEGFNEMARNTSNAIEQAIGIAEQRAEQLIVGPSGNVNNATDAYSDSVRPLVAIARGFGEIAKNVSKGALKTVGAAGEYAGIVLAGPGKAVNKTAKDSQS